MDDGTFPALLKTLSDSSEEVIKHDLQLLAQISSSSEESYFKLFMINLLELFSTDRKLLETRGSLIIRQLCLNLNTERIYRTFAEILEKEEVGVPKATIHSMPLITQQDLEFASGMVLKLNMILITSPELAEFRRRLKSLETRVSSIQSTGMLEVLTSHSKTVKHCSRRSTVRGVTTLSRYSHCACLLRRTNTRQIYYISCKCRVVPNVRKILKH